MVVRPADCLPEHPCSIVFPFERGVNDMSPIRISKLECAVRGVMDFNEAFNRQAVSGMMQMVSAV